jgi:hypothetical protein
VAQVKAPNGVATIAALPRRDLHPPDAAEGFGAQLRAALAGYNPEPATTNERENN